jgi:signal transduction histidine kinase
VAGVGGLPARDADRLTDDPTEVEVPHSFSWAAVGSKIGQLADQGARDAEDEQLYRAIHDLNNLLATILNYAELLHDQAKDAQMRQDVEEIQRAATGAAQISRTILETARGGRG